MAVETLKDFANCPACGCSWAERENFLEDPKIEFSEYRANFKDLFTGKFIFTHNTPTCETASISIPVKEFTGLYTGTIYRIRATGSLYCTGFCFDPKSFEPCNSICECAHIREAMQIAIRWPKKIEPFQSQLAQLAEKCRSFRRFDQSKSINRQDLLDLVNLARLSPSAANQQPLKYFISCDPEVNSKIFPTLSWARYFRDWNGPSEGERPAGYVIVLADSSITKNIFCDDGIAVQMMKLGAMERGLGSCIINAFDEKALRELIRLPDYIEIRLVLALGVPIENVKLESADGSIRYYRDKDGVMHVPKRPMDEIIIKLPRKPLQG